MSNDVRIEETRGTEAQGVQPALDPYRMVLHDEVLPVARALNISDETLHTVLHAAQNLPRQKRAGVWKYPVDGGVERFISETLAHAHRNGQAVAVISLDLLNIGGMNASRSETWVNTNVIDPLLNLVLAAARDLVAGVEGAWFQLFHYGGGDEYVLVIYGIDDNKLVSINNRMLPAHDVTRAFDTLVRTAANYARDEGLDLVPHGKKWWRIGYWGTGVLYGISLWAPGETVPTAEQMLDKAFIWVQDYKRGLKGKEGNPLDISIWEQCRRMARMPWCILYKLFGIDLRRKKARQ